MRLLRGSFTDLASDFVGAIRTISVTVASPLRRYTIILGAGELRFRMTGDWLAILLVAAVLAVVIIITDKDLLDAMLVGARELIGSAGVV